MTRNKKIVISVISILVVLIMLFSVIAINVNSAAASKMFANTNVDTTDVDYEKNFEGDSTINLSKKNNAGSGFIKAAETKSLELYYKKDHYKQLGANGKPEKTQYVRYNVAVYDKAAKKLWTALPDDGIIPFDKLTDNNVTKMQSLVSFNYYDIGKDNNKTSESNVLNELVYESTDSSDGGGDVIVDLGEDTDTGSGNENLEDVSNAELSDIPNGIRISYDLPARSIKFAVDFKINGDSFDVTVPSDQIEEKLEEYTKLKSQRDAVAAEVSRFGESINDIKSLPAYKSLELDQKKQINSRIRTTIESVSAVATQLKTGSSTTERIGDLDGNLFDLQTMLMEFPGFEGVAEKYIETFNGLRSKLSDLDSSSLCGLVSVTPLPYFGCATDKENGYVFYPDKSGAISYFNVRHPEYASTFTKAVYSNYISDIATYLDWTDEEDTDKHETFTTVTMPVFGIKKDNAAFLAIIAEGDADAYIDYNPYSTSTYMNSANASFYMRITTQNTSSEGNVSSIIDSEMVKQNRRIRYKFLSGKDADYAGMAVKYREHLEEFGLIQKSRYLESDTLPLFLSLYMGNKTYGNSVKAEYKSVTTFNEAQNILKDLKSKGVGRINAYMSGWSSAGYYDELPDNKLKPESKNGGSDDLAELAKYASSNNVGLALENQFIFGAEDFMTYNQKDIGTTKNYGNFTISFWNRYMFNPNVVFNAALEAQAKYKKYGINTAMFTHEGRLVYDDYNKNAPTRYNRKLTQQTFVELAKRMKGEDGAVGFEMPNIYMAQVADWFHSVPDTSDELLITDESVPFVQLVLHGYIPYTGEAYNNMYEINRQSLKYIEYGYLPFYILTAHTPDIRDNGVSFLCSTEYTEWADKIAATTKEYQQNLGELWKLKITDHEKLKNGLVCVTYENGYKVLVNYSNQVKKYNGTAVKPVSYAVVK